MKKLAPLAAAFLVAAAPMLSLGVPHQAAAQTTAAPAPAPAPAPPAPTLPSVPDAESVTLQGKIYALNAAKRWVTLINRAGNRVTVVAGPAVRMHLLRVGDSVNVHYVRSVAFAVTSPSGGNGVPTSDDKEAAILSQNVSGPGGIGLRLTKISGTVVGVDLATHSLRVVNPSGGGVYTIDVTDPDRIAMLPSLKVGEKITAVITEALAVSIDRSRHRWF
jgi:hypothetical protein